MNYYDTDSRICISTETRVSQMQLNKTGFLLEAPLGAEEMTQWIKC